MFKKICFLAALILIFLTGVAYGSVIVENEPNNAPEKTNPVAVGDTVRRQINYGDDSDYFRIVLPQSGIATVNISGYPSDCRKCFGLSSKVSYCVCWVCKKRQRQVAELFFF
jgi:hypothetical protein